MFIVVFVFLLGPLSDAAMAYFIDNSGLGGVACVGAVYNIVSKYRELVGRLRELESSICRTQRS
jgi:hypothetical protein